MATIIIVDDNLDSARFMQRLLEMEGHVAVGLPGGHTVVDVVCNMHPDLLLLDVMMPGLSGIDLLRMIRSIPTMEYLPVVMLSGVMDIDVQAEAFKLGAVDYIVKDMDWQRSLGRICNHIKKN